MKFQSTLPARGATRIFNSKPISFTISIHAPREGSDNNTAILFWRCCNFNPRSPRGERHTKAMDELANCEISIHAPREGSDKTISDKNCITSRFQSTLPARGATISIPSIVTVSRDFNPRSPRGERPRRDVRRVYLMEFQSTLPARGATL